MQASHQATLPLSHQLNAQAQKTYVFPGLKNASLLSIGQLCDNGCLALFDKYKLFIFKDNKIILQGFRNFYDGLWDVKFPRKVYSSKPQLAANAIIRKDRTKYDLANFYHGCLFSPALLTLQNAIKQGHFITWPGMHKLHFSRLVTDTTNIDLGHLTQERQNLQSTKTTIDTIRNDFFPQPTSPNIRSHNTMSLVIPFSAKEISYGDITGSFPFKSSRGNQYIYLLYDYDSNAIFVEPMKTRQAQEITTTWKKLYERLSHHGHTCKHFILDNECSEDLKRSFKKYNITYQFVPPYIHRQNAAERAIRTFKSHFLSGLATCDSNFPITEWDRLLPQAELTLNHLRTARCNPNLSAHAYINGMHDFNKVPLAPPGTKVIIHQKIGARNSWSYRGKSAWYIGPAPNHYRCFKCFVPETRQEVIVDTLTFIPTKVAFPTYDVNMHLKTAIDKIIKLLTISPSNNHPINNTHQTIVQTALKNVATLLGTKTLSLDLPKPKSPTAPNVPSMWLTNKPYIKTVARNVLLNKHAQQAPRVLTTLKHLPSTTLAHSATTSVKRPSVPIVPTLPPMPHWTTADNLNATINHLVQCDPLHILNPRFVLNHVYDEHGKRQSLDMLLANPKTEPTWAPGVENELGRLAQGFDNRVTGTNTIYFIHRHEVPSDRKISYANFVCDYRPLKSEPYRVRMTVGGDRLDYPDETASPAASLIESKMIFNSVISDHKSKGARFCGLDIKDFFLSTTMDRPEYIRIHKKYFSTRFLDKYKLWDKIASDNYIYVKICKGMYGLKQAAILAYKQLVNNLGQHGYSPIPLTTGLWKHNTRDTVFALCVDDFGVKYTSKENINHLIAALKIFYQISIDWQGQHYCGLTLQWNYGAGYVDVSMPGYVHKALKKFQHPVPLRPQHAPHKWTRPTYGAKTQFAPNPDTTDKLGKTGITRIQQINGTFLYYGRAIDPTILVALNEIATQQASPSIATTKKADMLMDYLSTYPHATLRFYAGDMQLCVESDAAYLVLPRARSRIAGHFYLNATPVPNKAYPGTFNAPILTECATIKNVVSSAAEAETAALFHNCTTAIALRTALIGLGHPQTKTVVKTDNTTASSFVHSEMRVKRSKSWDMKYNWLRDRVAQDQFHIKWDRGSHNQADYFTKHHPPSHHKTIRSNYILKGFHMAPLYSTLVH